MIGALHLELSFLPHEKYFILITLSITVICTLAALNRN